MPKLVFLRNNDFGKRSGVFLHQEIDKSENRYKPPEVHPQHLAGCGVWFQHLTPSLMYVFYRPELRPMEENSNIENL